MRKAACAAAGSLCEPAACEDPILGNAIAAEPKKAQSNIRKMKPKQEPKAFNMDNEQQWPEDAGAPEYAVEYGAVGPHDSPQTVGLFQHLADNIALQSVHKAQLLILT